MAALAIDGQPETQQTLRGAADRKAAGLDASSLHTRTTAAGKRKGGKERRKGKGERKKGGREGALPRRRGGRESDQGMGPWGFLNGSVGALAKCHKLSLPELTESLGEAAKSEFAAEIL